MFHLEDLLENWDSVAKTVTEETSKIVKIEIIDGKITPLLKQLKELVLEEGTAGFLTHIAKNTSKLLLDGVLNLDRINEALLWQILSQAVNEEMKK